MLPLLAPAAGSADRCGVYSPAPPPILASRPLGCCAPAPPHTLGTAALALLGCTIKVSCICRGHSAPFVSPSRRGRPIPAVLSSSRARSLVPRPTLTDADHGGDARTDATLPGSQWRVVGCSSTTASPACRGCEVSDEGYTPPFPFSDAARAAHGHAFGCTSPTMPYPLCPTRLSRAAGDATRWVPSPPLRVLFIHVSYPGGVPGACRPLNG